MKLTANNPFTGELLYSYNEMTASELASIVKSMQSSFSDWKNFTFEERSIPMRQLASLLRRDAVRWGKQITMEMGKPISQAVAEVEKCAWVCDFYAENAAKFLAPERVPTDGDDSYIRYDPLGIILAIMPWNFPFWQVFRFAAPALMAGNCALLKHSSTSQLSARAIEELFTEAGFPDNVFRNLRISAGRVEAIISEPAVKAITLTGSDKAGQSVATAAGRNLKKTVLELGGNNAFIVLDDADLIRAAETGVVARTQNGGQSCIAAKRFLVHESVAEQFVEELLLRVNNLKVGDPMKKETDVGPLVSVSQALEVERQVLESVNQGAHILTGGFRKGSFYMPTLMIQVTPGMPVFDEEVFGPVLPVITFKNTDDCISLSNSSAYGLGVNIFTGDIAKAEKLASEFEDGAVFINAMVKSDPRLPFGGSKRSGYGRELSYHGIREFVNIKTVFIKK